MVHLTGAQKVAELQKRLTRAVDELKKQYKKPALFISGGLDSAIIQSIGMFDNLYCCSWEDCDNITAAKKAAGKGHNVKVVSFTKDEMLEVLPQIKKLTNEHRSWSQVCQWFMAKRATEDGCDAVFTGEGADELFHGYSRYRILYWLERMFNDPLLHGYLPIVKDMVGERKALVKKMCIRNRQNVFGIEKIIDSQSMASFVATFDANENLQPLIKNETAMITAYGLVACYPFLDASVFEYAVLCSDRDKITATQSKAILRRVAHNLGVHQDIITETTKKGLFIPQSWRPEDADLWSTQWFDKLMEEA